MTPRALLQSSANNTLCVETIISLDLTSISPQGWDDQFKGNAGNCDTQKPGPPKVTNPPNFSTYQKVIKAPTAVAAMPNISHLDVVPQPTPINRNRWVCLAHGQIQV